MSPRAGSELINESEVETAGLVALLGSIAVCGAVAGLLFWFGRRAENIMFRKEAMAVVGLSWVLATVLGAFPSTLPEPTAVPPCGCSAKTSPRWYSSSDALRLRNNGRTADPLSPDQYAFVERINDAGAAGLSTTELEEVLP